MLTRKDFVSLSDFRYRLRRFRRFSEDVVKKDDVTPLQSWIRGLAAALAALAVFFDARWA
jgi:hypothetical protein